MSEVVLTDEFETWLRNTKYRRGQLRLVQRIDRLAEGKPGYVGQVGKAVAELRLKVGPGYRIYYLQHRDTLVPMLCGGDKSTQRKDIEKAHELAEEWRTGKENEEGRQ